MGRQDDHNEASKLAEEARGRFAAPNATRAFTRACLCACVFVVRGGMYVVVRGYVDEGGKGGIICFFFSGSVGAFLLPLRLTKG